MARILMQNLRTPFFLLALALIAIAVLIELGIGFLPTGIVSPPNLATDVPPEVSSAFNQLDTTQKAELAQLSNTSQPPGMAIPYLALLDGIVLFTVALMGSGLIIPPNWQGRVQGIGTLVFSIVILLVALSLIFAALALVLLMVALLLSIPFGTIVYLILFGSFDVVRGLAILSFMMLLKLGSAGSLVVAQQRFLQNWGLVLIILTSLVANIIISFLYSFVPRFLVSITDGIAAIIVAILAIIWAVFLLIGAIISVITLIRLSSVRAS